MCIPGRIQHLLGAVPINLSRKFAHEHDEAITTTVADTLTKRDKLFMQRKLSNHGLGPQHGGQSGISLSRWFYENSEINHVCFSSL